MPTINNQSGHARNSEAGAVRGWMRESGCRIRGGSLRSVAQVARMVPARQSDERRLAQDGTKLGSDGEEVDGVGAREDMPCGRYSLLAASGGFASRFLMKLVSNRQRVLEGPKCSWVLPAASRLSFQSSGCSPRPPRSRSEDWWVRQAKDVAEGGDVTAAFRTEGSKGRIAGWAGRWIGCVVWRCGRGSKWFVSIRRDCRGSKLKEGSKAQDRLTDQERPQGSRELSSHAADARKVGLGRAEVGGVGGLAGCWCGHWAPGPGWEKRIPFPLVAKEGDPIAVVYSFLGARACPAACPGDYGRLRPTARTGPGLWGSSSRFRWTLGSGHPGPGYLPTRPLEPPPSQNGSLVLGLGPVRRLAKEVVSSCAQQSSEQPPNCAYLSWRYGFTKLASAGTKMTDRPTGRDRQRQTDRAPRALRLDRADLRVGNLAASSVLPVRGARDDSAL